MDRSSCRRTHPYFPRMICDRLRKIVRHGWSMLRIMRELHVMLIDSPGFSRDVLAALIGGLPGVRLVPAEPDVVVVDDRHFASAVPFLRSGVPTIALGADDMPGYAERARREGAVSWLAKDTAHGTLPELISGLAASPARAPRAAL
jgi:hypothetical protein